MTASNNDIQEDKFQLPPHITSVTFDADFFSNSQVRERVRLDEVNFYASLGKKLPNVQCIFVTNVKDMDIYQKIYFDVMSMCVGRNSNISASLLLNILNNYLPLLTKDLNFLILSYSRPIGNDALEALCILCEGNLGAQDKARILWNDPLFDFYYEFRKNVPYFRYFYSNLTRILHKYPSALL